MGASSTSFIQTKSAQLGIGLTIATVLFAALFRFVQYPNDRTRCQSLLNHGWWMDEGYRKWQPAGCLMHTYAKDDIAPCLTNGHVLYIGDSIARQQFHSFVQLIRHDVNVTGPKHVDRKYEFADERLVFEFWWDPYLNSSRTIDLFKAVDPAMQPSLLVVGAGSWHMRYLEENYMETWTEAMGRVLTGVQRSSGIADLVVISPVEVPEFDLMSPERLEAITMDKISAMNAFLQERQTAIKPLTPTIFPFVWNTVATTAWNVTTDGLHYDTPVTSMQTQLILNYQCNNGLEKHYPYDATCCFHYPMPKWYQNLFFVIFLSLVPIAVYIVGSNHTFLGSLRSLLPTASVLNSLFIFGLGVTYMFVSDRTHVFDKIGKHFDAQRFITLTTVTWVAGVLTLKTKKEGDQGFLNRNQTEEWKGWMQLVILIYHILGASSVSGIYNVVRVLVASYLFQTGYGHFFFFYKKADFGMIRILNVMVRLNLLTCTLQYVMDTDYMDYYFAPLVSFWFSVVWLVMFIGHKHNQKPLFLLSKIAVAAVTTAWLTQMPNLIETVFGFLEVIGIHWNASEWRFRLMLDIWIVYVGMLCAYAYIKIHEHHLTDHALWPLVKKLATVLSTVALIWYFAFELSCPDKFTYNQSHPHISWIPILAYIILRNATVGLRNTSSRLFIFFGKISLETFIGQFHMWLAADTKGLLVLLPNNFVASGLGWLLNLTVSTVIFVYVCYYINQSTSEITKSICNWIVEKRDTHGSDRPEELALPEYRPR